MLQSWGREEGGKVFKKKQLTIKNSFLPRRQSPCWGFSSSSRAGPSLVCAAGLFCDPDTKSHSAEKHNTSLRVIFKTEGMI